MKREYQKLVAILVVVGATACGGGRPPATTESTSAAATQTPTPSVNAQAPGDSIAAAETARVDSADPAEAERAQRQAEAQSYLDRARDDAEARHRHALDGCGQQVAESADACVANADEALEAEMRAARVEFDQRMMRGE